jgi:hypothetical protein
MKDKLNHSKLCEKANQEWRNPLQIINFEGCFNPAKSQLLKYIVCGDWWDIIHRLNIRLLVSREYEHLLICLSCDSDSPRISFMTIPHPSGIAVDQDKKAIYVASTRNPNMIYEFNPINGFIERRDKNKFKEVSTAGEKTLIPVRVFFLPGSLYIHDMISMNENLYASAVGHNSIIQISDNGEYKYVWWPKCVDKENKPDIQDNYIQLNSIAGNKTIADSYFTSSTEKILSTRPGDINFPVIKRGVLFNGKTKEVVCRGLTRPHSARMNKGKVWLNNSGYGEFGFVEKNKFFKLLKLPG